MLLQLRVPRVLFVVLSQLDIPMTSKSINRRKPSVDYKSLEQRRLLAGNVTVFENVHLYIRGDADDNQFEIVADGDQLRINGLDGTTINGEESVLVEGATVTESGVSFKGGLRAHLGPGHDDFKIADAQFEDMSLVYGGTGDDKVDVNDSRFLDRTVIQTFDGNDTVSTHGSYFMDTFFAITLDGQDSVSMVDSTLEGDSIVVTGNHADSIHSDSNHYLGETNLVLTFGGDDTVQLDNPVVGEHQLGVYLGFGDDTFGGDMTEATVDGTIKIGGQGGVDQTHGMRMSDEVAPNVTMATIEQDLVFDNGTGGIEGVEATQSGYFNSASDNFRVANDVTLDSTQTINRISWSGIYSFDEAFTEDNFTIEFYEGIFYNDIPYSPEGDPIASFNVGNEVNRVDTGIELQNEAGATLYSYSADIDITLEEGTTYWVSIFAENEEEVPGNGQGSSFNHFQWGFRTNYSVWQEPEYLGEVVDLENTAVYTYGDFSISDPGWFNDFADVRDAPQDFQLLSVGTEVL